MADLEGLEAEIGALEATMSNGQSMASAFDAELREMTTTMASAGREVNVLSGGISRGLRKAVEGMVFDGDRLSTALQGVGKSMIDAAYSAAVRPVSNHFGGLLARGLEGVMSGVMPFAAGGAFSQGRVMPFARGGVISQATAFPMRGGVGLMGEAGPEAIMPLKRGADGRLGVAAAGGGKPVQVVMNINTPDVEGFRRSQSQIAAQMGRILSRGQRNR